MTQPTVSTTEYRDFTAADGRTVIQARIDRHWDGTSVTVAHSDILGRQYPTGTEHELDTYLAWLDQAAATPGMTLCLIEDAAGVLTSAVAIVDEAEQAMLDGIAANMQAAQPEPVDVSDIMADADPNWRRNLRNQVVQAAKNTSRPDFTKTRVHTQPPTPAEMARIRAHRNGVVTCAPGQSWTLLQAIEARGYGTGVRVDPNRPKLAYLRLNARGWALIQSKVAAA